MHDRLRPYDKPLDFDAAAHLWRRAGFGADPRTVQRTVKLGLLQATERLVNGPRSEPATDDLEFIYQSVLGADDEQGARAWLLLRMLRSEHQVREKAALFWHGHFATSLAKVRDLGWMLRQYRLFLDHGLGKFATLLDAVARDPAMIRWLDNETNRKGHANENYAREVLELFTLGEGNYSEADIQEAARAFTGWHIQREEFHFARSLHDKSAKTVLGQTGNWGGEDVQRIALEQPACGEFLAGKLLRFYVMPNPDPAVVKALGASMRANGYDIAATLKSIFRSRLFYSDAARRSLVKSPIDFVIGSARALEIKKPNMKAAVPALRAMGHDLLAPPNVKGWPGHRAWINTATWLVRVRAARGIAAQVGESTRLDDAAHAVLGNPLPEQETTKLKSSGAGNSDLLHALLTTPEAHLL
ncbi:MAG: DUF1800 domain-containing protein [Planctomycetota bacterium]|jgi:uncharacterized protein (DUF1800 family)